MSDVRAIYTAHQYEGSDGITAEWNDPDDEENDLVMIRFGTDSTLVITSDAAGVLHDQIGALL